MAYDSPAERRPETGFSLVEMLIVVAIIAIMAAIALPNIGTYVRNYRIRGAAQSVASTLQSARGKAIATNTNRGVSFFVVDFDSYRFVQEDLAAVGDDPRQPVQDLPVGVRFVVATGPNSGPSIRFNRMGGFCNPGVSGCPTVFANPCGTDTARCTTNAGADFFAQEPDGTLVVTLLEQSTNLTRTVRIAPGGRVLPQP